MKAKLKSDSLAYRMFDMEGNPPSLKCPMVDEGRSCEGVPHMRCVEFGRGVPVTSKSGPGMIVHFYCETGHMWELRLEDHSAGTWLRVVPRSPDPAGGM